MLLRYNDQVRPAVYIPSLYFASGLPYTVVTKVSGILLKNFGVDNQVIGVVTGILQTPWTVKLLWAPWVDATSTRRSWVIASQAVLACEFLLLAILCVAPNPVSLVIPALFLIAISSATQDISIDGFYLEVLDKEEQAFFVGIRNTAYRMAWIFSTGFLVYLAGTLFERHIVGLGLAWSAPFAFSAVILFALVFFHRQYLPIKVVPSKEKNGMSQERFVETFKTFFAQPKIGPVVAYILLFRLGDALLLAMAGPFLLDPKIKGGLAVSTSDQAIIYGTVGTTFLLIGGILGGWIVSKYGLRRMLFPLALIQNSAILLYWILALTKPDLIWIACANAFEQAAYGLGNAAYTVFLLSTVKKDFKAAHYAIASALMALGVQLPTFVSGFLVDNLGYANFFLVSFAASIPGFCIIPFLPLTPPPPLGDSQSDKMAA